MAAAINKIRIDKSRFREDFQALAEIGQTAAGGIHRPAFSQDHLRAREWFRRRAMRAGLEFRVDGAGNHLALHPAPEREDTTLMLGSHLDSVPDGGRFDGALGVAAALEVLETIKENDLTLKHHLVAVDFTDEEGAFVGLMGSRALAGILPAEEMAHPVCGTVQFAAAIKSSGLTHGGILEAAWSRGRLVGYLETHVEQGRRLKDQGLDIGVVSAIVGIRSFRVVFKGRADHAGTTPMNRRRDPALGAAAFTLSACKLVMDRFPDCVITVGDMQFDPGAFNVVA